METKCHLYDIVDPNPNVLSVETWREIRAYMDETEWFGEKGRRYGFVSTLIQHNLIIGFLIVRLVKSLILSALCVK